MEVPRLPFAATALSFHELHLGPRPYVPYVDATFLCAPTFPFFRAEVPESLSARGVHGEYAILRCRHCTPAPRRFPRSSSLQGRGGSRSREKRAEFPEARAAPLGEFRGPRA